MTGTNFTIPGGREKGTPVERASESALQYWIDRLQNNASPRDRELVTAMRAALAVRGPEGQAAQRPRTQPRTQTQTQTRTQDDAGMPRETHALARTPVDQLARNYDRARDVTAVMAEARQYAHVITPQRTCPELPEGFIVTASVVPVNVARDTYYIPSKDNSKRGLDRTALDLIAAAAAIDWDPALSMRMDSGRDPHYCAWRAVGYTRNLDGSPRTLARNAAMDLRVDSAMYIESEERARQEGKPNKELALMRKFIERHAETKAMNRATRALGVRIAYTPEELEMPFLVFSLMFTGRSDDPELKRLFSIEIARNFLNGRRALYAQPRVALPAPQLHDPPPLEAPVDDYSTEDEPYAQDAHDDYDERQPGDDGPDDGHGGSY